MEKTSRHYILDVIEMIGNDIALSSHYQELINNFEGDDVIVYSMLQEQLKETIERRRDSMLILQKSGTEKGRKDYRCIVKHSIASYMYASECSYADPDIDIKKIQQQAYESMIQNICIFLGIEDIVYCGRCMTDQLLQNNKE